MTDALDLFEQVVACTGLASFIGPGVVKRALQTVGVSCVEQANRMDYRRALPAIRARLSVYMTAEQVEARTREIGASLGWSSFEI